MDAISKSRTNLTVLFSVCLTLLVTVFGMVLASGRAMAEDNTSVVDQINITVPVSCTMSDAGM